MMTCCVCTCQHVPLGMLSHAMVQLQVAVVSWLVRTLPHSQTFSHNSQHPCHAAERALPTVILKQLDIRPIHQECVPCRWLLAVGRQ